MVEKELNYIVFYDGDCGFCNSTVQFILKHEKTDEVLFSALQSQFTSDFLKLNNFPEPDYSTLYFWSNGKLLKKSTAAIAILTHLKAPLSWLKIFKYTPLFIRDSVYDLIAKNRKKIQKETCFLPSVDQKKRFL